MVQFKHRDIREREKTEGPKKVRDEWDKDSR
jgi:hypothetical protein